MEMGKMMCKYCGSENLIKKGKSQGRQIFGCKDCGHRFVNNGNYAKMRTDKRIIVTALDMYFEGLSVRKIKRQIQKIFKQKVTQMAIWKWVRKYSELVKDYVDSLQLEHHSGEWRVDETAIKCMGKQRWFWEIIDQETKFMIASHFSEGREIKDALELFRDSKRRIKNKPKIVYVDGLQAYKKGFTKTYYSRFKDRCPTLVQRVGLKGVRNNNTVERLHGTLKDRLKPMRGIGGDMPAETFLKGWFVHYNFVRPHQSLNGRTPAEASGINLELEDGWGDLIEKATECKTMKEGDNSQMISALTVGRAEVGVTA